MVLAFLASFLKTLPYPGSEHPFYRMERVVVRIDPRPHVCSDIWVMKPIIVTAICLAMASVTNAFAQGQVIFNNRAGGIAHVYAPLGPGDTTRIVGQASNDNPPGSIDYGGRVPIGASGSSGQYGAATTFAQLLGAPGSSAPEATLLPALGGASTFRTGAAAGNLAMSVATFNNIAPDAPVGTFEMVAWDNLTGLYPTWANASVAWENGLIAAGKSPLFTLNNIGGNIYPPQTLFNNSNGGPPNGVVSFNLYFIPEPATAALAGLGVTMFLIFRRRN